MGHHYPSHANSKHLVGG